MNILIVAAENSALPGAKAGGLGDVIGEIGPELEKQGCRVTTIIPSYGFIHRKIPSSYVTSINFYFRGFDHRADVFEVLPENKTGSVQHLVVDHPLFGSPDDTGLENKLYSHDPPDRPFATDANKFALFSTAVASALVQKKLDLPDCIHLHDWHTAFFLILRKFHPYFYPLGSVQMVYTIHNLAMQGLRPFHGGDSALASWFPGLWFDWMDLHDPGCADCVNPMAAGIRLADKVHAVSPSYAKEILKPSQKPDVFSGGEGLETVLQYVHAQNRLTGILNGVVYPENRRPITQDFPGLCTTLKSAISGWLAGKESVPVAQFLAYARLTDPAYYAKPPSVLLTSVSRLTDQKMLMMKSHGSAGKSGLEEILRMLENVDGRYILLGSGDWEYERYFSDMSARFDNFIFLNGYSEKCAAALYANGDLFLMPSSFEPCGISQMLAMRDGQPCVVHHVGGLKDTVTHNHNGFAFTGDSLVQQVDNFITTTKNAVTMQKNAPNEWNKICRQAARERFSWQKSAARYIQDLYKR